MRRIGEYLAQHITPPCVSSNTAPLASGGRLSACMSAISPATR